MKVFITGINGFTGQHLSKYLKLHTLHNLDYGFRLPYGER